MARWIDALGFPRTAGDWAREALASIVVFLVALPLCMGIAIASGVEPALGLITGIVGGLVVGFFAGSPLQVSGPAAGLAVIVFEFVRPGGGAPVNLALLGPVVLLAGLLQAIAGALRLGQWFRAVSPAVIRGMLAGIGVLIFAGQFHVMLDDSIPGDGLTNLLTIPRAIYKGIFPVDGSVHHMAALIGIITIAILVLWNWLKPARLRFVPAALLAVVVASSVAAIFAMPISYVDVPDSLIEAANWLQPGDLARLLEPDIFTVAITIAAVASAETLLCATAVDQLHDGPRTKYDQELFAQGIGNAICGVFGALPMTGVIVRSSANVEAGAKTRVSAILHGLWLLALVAALPFILTHVPTSALAAILVYTGYKLFNPRGIIAMWRFDRVEGVILIATIVAILATDLLKGVLFGFALALLRLVSRLARLEIDEYETDDGAIALDLKGSATFLNLPKLARALEAHARDQRVVVDLSHVSFIDHACLELIQNWRATRLDANTESPLDQTMVDRFQAGVVLPTRQVDPSMAAARSGSKRVAPSRAPHPDEIAPMEPH